MAKLDTWGRAEATVYPTLIPEHDHACATSAPRLLKFHAPEIVFGIDSMVEAAHAALRLGARRPMLVTDPVSSKRAGPTRWSTAPGPTGVHGLSVERADGGPEG